MSRPARRPVRHMLGGALRVFLAEALLFPTGLVTAAVLTRRLGPGDYGLLTLASVIVAWVEWSIVSMFARATVRFVGEADDSSGVASTVVRLHLMVSLTAMALLWLLSGAVASVMGEPALAGYLRVFALDIPFFSLAHAHRAILIGTGHFEKRAVLSAARWISRMVLILLLLDWGVRGALLGMIGASAIELAVARRYVRPSFRRVSSFPLRPLLAFATPLFLYASSLRIFDRMDLAALKLTGGSAAQAGFYAAAQNICLLPAALSMSFAPLLLSTLTRMVRDGAAEHARVVARQSLRAAIGALPFAAIAAGAAGEIVTVVFGDAFASAAAPLRILIFSSVAMLVISICTAVLTAAARPGLTFALTGPLLPLAAAGYLWVLPERGVVGAATVATTVSGLGALACLAVVSRIWGIAPPAATLGRSAAVGALTYYLAMTWQTPDYWLVVKIAILSLLACAALLALGEISASERRRAWALLGSSTRKPAPSSR